MFSEEDMQVFSKSKICVIGCGGLGGYIIEMLARIGIGEITVIDGDTFCENNLNRQIISKENNIGNYKVLEAKKRVEEINSTIKINPIINFISPENIEKLIVGHNLIIDALDNIETRMMLCSKAKQLEIPYIYGAIAGWYGQVSTIFPEDNTLEYIYKSKITKGKEKELGNPSFTPAMVASMQVSEAIKVILKKGNYLRNKLLYIDLLNNEFEIIDFWNKLKNKQQQFLSNLVLFV